MTQLDGQVAVVTGAGRGIGLSLAQKLAAAGAAVIVNDLDEDIASHAVRLIRQMGGTAEACPGNVTDRELPGRLVDCALGHFDDVHIIVNNAGYVWNGPIHRTTDEQWNAMIAVHLTAPFRILRAFHEPISERVKRESAGRGAIGRRVVNVASVAATRGAIGQIAYASAKSGLFGLTRSLAKEWGHLNVTVNCVAFGLVDTRLTAASASDSEILIEDRNHRVGFRPETLEKLIASIPRGHGASPDEAAAGLMSFCLPSSSYITGQCIEIAGGIVY